MSSLPPVRAPLARYRAKAHLLLAALRSGDPSRAAAIATRLQKLRSFAGVDPMELVANRSRVRLKHALTLVAIEAQFRSWPALVHAYDPPAPSMWIPRHGGTLNRWFTNHDEAAASLRTEGGFLLPFGTQCFITERAGIEALGLDPDDPDWAAIGFDCVTPHDTVAHARLVGKRNRVLRGR